jgi:hypothetical protein
MQKLSTSSDLAGNGVWTQKDFHQRKKTKLKRTTSGTHYSRLSLVAVHAALFHRPNTVAVDVQIKKIH